MNLRSYVKKSTGVSKPRYNIQHAVSGGIVMNVGVYQTPGTLRHISHMNRYKAKFIEHSLL